MRRLLGMWNPYPHVPEVSMVRTHRHLHCKRQSRLRLCQSVLLTGQQNYIGRTSTRKQRDSEMLLYARLQAQQKVKRKGSSQS